MKRTVEAPSDDRMANAFNPTEAVNLDTESRTLVHRRAGILGPAYRLFYRRPIHIVRGNGVFLYDAEGNEYLDAYNNVPAVGHCNPKVVHAVTEQMKTLCTHTRYLNQQILDYSEELRSTFGGRVGRSGYVMFTCSGSEANDLAVRIARYFTGKKGIVVTADAYHGTTDLTSRISPALGPNCRLGEWVRRVPAPDSYRLPQRNLGDWFAEQVALQVADLERRGLGFAGFVVDPFFSSDGIYPLSADVLSPVAKVVRDSGGLFIADEVQAGFGRSGEKFWGFQRHDIDPDIVSMGKPMGNGYPVAGVAVDSDVAERFGTDVRYFNTFGGNSVAIAAAQVTFDVIRDEALQRNALVTGAMLRKGIKEIGSRHRSIGDVRGIGLYTGVEIVKDFHFKTPDPESANKIVNGLRDRGVLISATGAKSNTLKIRPPLIFSAQHVTRLLTELDATLRSIS